MICRPLTIPSITLPPSATDAFSAGKFTTKFDGDDAVDTAPKGDLLEEEEKYLEAFKVNKVQTCTCAMGCRRVIRIYWLNFVGIILWLNTVCTALVKLG